MHLGTTIGTPDLSGSNTHLLHTCRMNPAFRGCSPRRVGDRRSIPAYFAHGARIASVMPWTIFLSAGTMVASTPPSCGRAASPSPETK